MCWQIIWVGLNGRLFFFCLLLIDLVTLIFGRILLSLDAAFGELEKMLAREGSIIEIAIKSENTPIKQSSCL